MLQKQRLAHSTRETIHVYRRKHPASSLSTSAAGLLIHLSLLVPEDVDSPEGLRLPVPVPLRLPVPMDSDLDVNLLFLLFVVVFVSVRVVVNVIVETLPDVSVVLESSVEVRVRVTTIVVALLVEFPLLRSDAVAV